MLEKAEPSSQKQRVSEIKQKYQELSPRSLNWTEVEQMHQDLLTVVAIASIGIQNPYQTLELSKLKAQNKKLQNFESQVERIQEKLLTLAQNLAESEEAKQDLKNLWEDQSRSKSKRQPDEVVI